MGDTQIATCSHKTTLFFQNKESRLKTEIEFTDFIETFVSLVFLVVITNKKKKEYIWLLADHSYEPPGHYRSHINTKVEHELGLCQHTLGIILSTF
jgi:hypothetical protein